MRETWLRPNRRALLFGAALPSMLLLVGLLLVFVVPRLQVSHPAVAFLGSWLGWFLLGISGLAIGALTFLMRLPRLAYQDGFLLVYLRNTEPIRVPIELVECFFAGQGPSLIAQPRLPADAPAAETATIVIRLAESAHEWQRVPVKPALGAWCDGYITIRGTWCEPIDGDLIRKLNRRLSEVHRARRDLAGKGSR